MLQKFIFRPHRHTQHTPIYSITIFLHHRTTKHGKNKSSGHCTRVTDRDREAGRWEGCTCVRGRKCERIESLNTKVSICVRFFSSLSCSIHPCHNLIEERRFRLVRSYLSLEAQFFLNYGWYSVVVVVVVFAAVVVITFSASPSFVLRYLQWGIFYLMALKRFYRLYFYPHFRQFSIYSALLCQE